MSRLAEHRLKVVCHERGIRRNLKKVVKQKLSNTNNEILLTNIILSYLSGPCDKCGFKVSTLKTHRLYKNICVTCYKSLHSGHL